MFDAWLGYMANGQAAGACGLDDPDGIRLLTLIGGVAYLAVILLEQRVLHYLPARRPRRAVGQGSERLAPEPADTYSVGHCSRPPHRPGSTHMAWTTPTLVEICIGLEINGYLPAEF
jgi:coenzyme PQQ precursor peptide PqqA